MPTSFLKSSRDRNRRAGRYQSALAETILGRYKAEFVRRNEPERMVEDLELAAMERIVFL
jgi:hypothetical protein